MKNNIIMSIMLAVAFSVGVSAFATTEHDNDVYLNAGNGITKIDFKYDGNMFITGGQPWGGVTGGWDSGAHQCHLVALAGRHGSGHVADWFNDKYAHDYDRIGDDASSSKPAKLNFAFEGTLIINGESFPKVVLAQGHNTRNNWWLEADMNTDHQLKGASGSLYDIKTDGVDGFDISEVQGCAV